MTLGELIKEKRLERGMTLKEVANQVGVSEACVSRWESGSIGAIKSKYLIILVETLGISFEELAYDKDGKREDERLKRRMLGYNATDEEWENLKLYRDFLVSKRKKK